MDEKIESLAKGRAIHRPEGWIASYRAKVWHLVEGKMEPNEYLAFDVLLHVVGWDKRKPNYGKIERNITRLRDEWFSFWSRPTLIKAINGLTSKLYIEDDGDWLTIPNFAKYQSKATRETVKDFDSEPDTVKNFDTPTVKLFDSDCKNPLQQASNIFTPDPPQTRTGSESCEPKQTNKLKQIDNPPIVPQPFDVFRAFEVWWSSYPRKSNKATARELWKDICHDQDTFDQLMKTLEWQKTSEGWTKDGGRYIPNPAKYLDEEKYEERPIEVAPKPQTNGGMIGWPYWKQWGFNSFEECQAWEAEQARQREASG